MKSPILPRVGDYEPQFATIKSRTAILGNANVAANRLEQELKQDQVSRCIEHQDLRDVEAVAARPALACAIPGAREERQETPNP
jgi:hypothetical protein